MKATNHFTRTILTYLEQRAETDSLFAESFAKDTKNIDDCVTYILNTVQKSGCNGFSDLEIYSLATHYYDEDDLQVGSPIQGQVVVNYVVELTQEEKDEARREAMEKAIQESIAKLKQPKKKPLQNQTKKSNQLSFF